MATKTDWRTYQSHNGSEMERRVFLAGAAALGTGLMEAQPPLRKKIRSLLAEGSETIDTVIGTQPLVVPPDLEAALQAGAQVRLRVEYPFGKNLLVVSGFVAAANDPPPPLPELPQNDPRIFTIIIVEIEFVLVSMSPQPTFGMLGRTVAEPKPSPFFPNLTDRISGLSCGFQNEGETTFSMLGFFAAGNHASYARVASGRIELQA